MIIAWLIHTQQVVCQIHITTPVMQSVVEVGDNWICFCELKYKAFSEPFINLIRIAKAFEAEVGALLEDNQKKRKQLGSWFVIGHKLY